MKRYGLEWNRAIEAGGLVLGEEIRIELRVEAHTTAWPGIDAIVTGVGQRGWRRD